MFETRLLKLNSPCDENFNVCRVGCRNIEDEELDEPTDQNPDGHSLTSFGSGNSSVSTVSTSLFFPSVTTFV